MSRKEIALPQDALLVVGWDPAQATFYAQGFKPRTMSACEEAQCFVDGPHVRRECEDELVELWVGTSHGELPTLEDLERALGEVAPSLSDSIKAELLQAKERNE